MNEQVSQIVDAAGNRQTVEKETNPIAFLIGVESVLIKFVRFQDRSFNRDMLPMLDALAEKVHFGLRQQNYSHVAMKTTNEFDNVKRGWARNFQWKTGTYAASFSVSSPSRLKLTQIKFQFQLNDTDTAAISSVPQKELVNKRIENLLKSISLDETKVKPYRRGLSYYIQTTYPAIERICLPSNEEGNEITLVLCFGDSPRQAKAFYNSKINIGHLDKTEWEKWPNFHVSFMDSNLVRFESEDSEHYLQFWKENIENIRQQKRGDVKKYLQWLIDAKVITMTKDAKQQLREKFYNTERQTLNICPGFELNYTFNISKAEELDKSGKLKFILAEKIKEGLKVVGLDGREILKSF
jgi:hypothetical protein